MQLQSGSFLQGGKYKIESILGQGGFGITYQALQTGLNRQVAIKEFFMKDYCERNEKTSHIIMGTQSSRELVERFRQKFIKEAQIIAGLAHTHIISIYDVFEENDTAYYVMEYIDGGSLKERIETNGAMSDSEALSYVLQIADALEYLHHRKTMHLDVKPSNILLRNNGEAVLIDFGISKRYDDTGNQTSSTPIGISKGYAPLEQYKQGGVKTFSPGTDIYSLGATLFYLLTSQQPPEASDVNDEGLPALPTKISPLIRKAIQGAMQPRCKDRPQNINEFLTLLNEGIKPGLENETTILDTPKNEFVAKEHPSSIPKPQRIFLFKKEWLWGVIALILILCTIWLSRTNKTSNIAQDNSLAIGLDSTVSDSAILTSPISMNNSALHDSSIRYENSNTEIGQTRTNVQHNEISTDQIVDLGLSVRWAGWNLGASTPEDFGSYYAWGETEEKSVYEYKTYSYWQDLDESGDYILPDCKGGDCMNYAEFVNIGNNISGTNYDVAHVRWGGNWRMPTYDECAELKKCKQKWIEYHGVGGLLITGPNGNSIFLPAVKYKGENVLGGWSKAWYWTASIHDDVSSNAYYLGFNNDKYGTMMGGIFRWEIRYAEPEGNFIYH